MSDFIRDALDAISSVGNMDPFERPATEGRETHPGVVEVTRSWPHVTYLIDTSNVHLHYWQDDDGLDERGYGVTDLVCHGCNQATRVTYPASIKPDSLVLLRETFVAGHHEHRTLDGELLCPPLYSLTEQLDLRRATAQEER